MVTNGAKFSKFAKIDDSTFTNHLSLAAENSLASQAAWLLTDEEIETIEAFLSKNPNATKAMLVSRLPSKISTQQLLYYLNSTSCSQE